MKRIITIAVAGWVWSLAVLGADAPTLRYENNFQTAALDKVPEDFLVLDGGFAVKQDGDNKFLELPGAPLDTFGALFGPTEKENVAAAARVFGTGKGRRFPTFGVGVGGVGGFRVQVSPAKKSLELFKGDTLRTSVPFTWESGKWTWLRAQVRKLGDGRWIVEGKAWNDGEPEPAWTLTSEEKEEPPAGRASVWGSPYATTPIRFDDLKVTTASAP